MTLCSGGIQEKGKVRANPDNYGLGCPQEASCPHPPPCLGALSSPGSTPLLVISEPNHFDSISVFCVVSIRRSVPRPPSLGCAGKRVPRGLGLYHFTCHRSGPQNLSRNVEKRGDPIPSPSTFLESDCLRVRSTGASKSPSEETDLSRLRSAQPGGGVGAGSSPTPRH